MKKSLYIVNDGKHDREKLANILITALGYTVYQAEQINILYSFNNICLLKRDSEKKLVDIKKHLDHFDVKNMIK